MRKKNINLSARSLPEANSNSQLKNQWLVQMNFLLGFSASIFRVKLLTDVTIRCAFLKETWNVTPNMYSPFFISRDPRYAQAPHRSFPSFPDFFSCQATNHHEEKASAGCKTCGSNRIRGELAKTCHPSMESWLVEHPNSPNMKS